MRGVPRPSSRPLVGIALAGLLAAGLAVVGPLSPAQAVAPDGPVLAFGNNSSGQLGNGGTTNSTAAVAVITSGALAGKRIVATTAGGAHSCALTADGLVACWGSNGSGQLGNGTTTNSSSPVSVRTTGVLAGKRVVAVEAGGTHTCAVTSDGIAACWGENGSGQLGIGSTVDSSVPVAVSTAGVLSGAAVTGISAGSNQTCAVTAAGRAVCWGSNIYGQLGDGTVINRTVPVHVFGTLPPAVSPVSGEQVVQVGAGDLFTCARTASGRVACWGRNTIGRLGVPSTDTCAAVACSKTPLALTDYLTPGSGVLAGRTASALGVGANNACVATSDGKAVCWGYNAFGQVGDGTDIQRDTPVFVVATSAIPLNPAALQGRTVTQISVGSIHSCARTSDGALACWGGNTSGQLGVTIPNACLGNTVPCAKVPRLLTGQTILALPPTPNPLFPAYVVDVSAGGAQTVLARAVAPSAPGGVTGTPGNAQATVSWTVPADDGGAPVTGFVVQRSTDGGATWTDAPGSPAAAAATSLVVTGLANGTPVTFRVAANTAVGTGPFSAPSVPVTPTTGVVPPGAPTAVVATAGNAQASVTWVPPAATGGAPVTGYAVQRSTDSGATWTDAPGSPAAAPPLTVTGLANGVPVSFRVAATNSAGTGPYSTPSVPVTPKVPVVAPGPIGIFRAAAASRARVVLAWSTPTGGSPAVKYQVRWRAGTGAYSKFYDRPTSPRALALALTPNVVYGFQVRAVNAAGAGPITSASVRTVR